MEIVNENVAIDNVPWAIEMSDGDIKTQLGLVVNAARWTNRSDLDHFCTGFFNRKTKHNRNCLK